ncbi:pilus assembly protein PilE [Lysobacteraceae bacterium NML07-0707]|nr:pilus assembly protein PilE [Xanthomonadaceae bacterium NML07-0707]
MRSSILETVAMKTEFPHYPSMLDQSRAQGFTLIELLIVVAVVSILAVIAYPSYTEHIRKSRRAQAKADLVEYMQMAERFHTVNNTYVGFALPYTLSPREATAANAKYDMSIEGAATRTIKIVATPRAGSGQTADKCGTLSVNQASIKTNSQGTLDQCW